MGVRSNFSKIILRQAGYSLIELVMVVGILGVVAAGTSAHLLNQYREQNRMGSKANMIQTEGLIAKAFSKTASGARACNQILKPVENFSATGETDVRLDFGGTDILQASGKVTGITQFTINRLYLSDKISLAPQRPNSYLANLYMIGDVGPMDRQTRTKPRNVGTIVVTLNPDNTISECNVSVSQMTENQVCDGMYGMYWNDGKCEQKLNIDPSYNLKGCFNGTHDVAGICVPTASGCANGQIADGFDLGVTQGCAEPPLNPAVGVATLGVPPPVEGVPDQIPQRSVSSVPALVPVTTGSIAPSSTPQATPAECAVNGATMDTANYALCMANSYCAAALTAAGGVTGTNCATTQPVAYSPPSSTPSNAPPNDGSCQCNSARIANGDYCSYCSSNINIGYQFVDYAYAVNKCKNGNLVPVGGAAFDPLDECSGGYAPTKYIGGKYRQIGGYDLR